ncbi:MAG TPA: FlgT C-terminal domain-containing protein [Pyrinomonadaceae bacterium]
MRSCDPVPVRKLLVLLLLLLFCAFAHAAASAQTGGRRTAPQRPQTPAERPTLVAPEDRVPAPAARPSEFACGGFIEQTPQAAVGQIVGAEQEAERRIFAEGNLVYIDAGAQAGVRAGQEFTVVRPRGQFRSKFSLKKGSLGVYTQEVGRLRVVRVRDRVSVAEVRTACGDLLVGDLLRPAQDRDAPDARAETALDRFAEPSGRQSGRLVLARDGREVVTRDDVVFVDLGAEDGVKVGDYLTVYRPEGHGRLVNHGDEQAANARRGFESEEFQGGGFSNQTQRVRDVNGSKYEETVKTPAVRRTRPAVPRKVVGELVILRVEGRTATAVVTRIAQEIHTGDAVEVQ